MRERIGRYRIERVLGSGGMGVVYLGVHDDLHRKAAIKIFRSVSIAEDEGRQRLMREGRAHARLEPHPNIVTIYDVDEDAGEIFLETEYVDGQTLAEILNAAPGSRLPWAQAVAIGQQILTAIDFVHAHGIVHRDIKPSNLMIADGVVKLTDFGIALIINMPRQTNSGYWGTWQYAAPEQFDRASVIDHRCDLYSTGVVLYRMLAGRTPYSESDFLAAAAARRNPPPDLHELAPDVSSAISEVVHIALQAAPADRFATAKEFRNALAAAAEGLLPATTQRVAPEAVDQLATVPSARPDQPEIVTVSNERSHSDRWLSYSSLLIIVLCMVALFVLWRAALPPRGEGAATLPVRVHTNAHRLVGPPTATTAKEADTLAAPKEPPAPPVVPAAADDTPPSEHAQTASETTGEAEQRRELQTLQAAIDDALQRAGELIASRQHEAAQAELDRAAILEQRAPAELRPRHEAIVTLRAKLTQSMVDEQTELARQELERSMWEQRLSTIDAYMNAPEPKWTEARNDADGLSKDPRAPEGVRLRARALYDRAVSGIRNGMASARLGTTKTTIRKPSTPPRR